MHAPAESGFLSSDAIDPQGNSKITWNTQRHVRFSLNIFQATIFTVIRLEPDYMPRNGNCS